MSTENLTLWNNNEKNLKVDKKKVNSEVELKAIELFAGAGGLAFLKKFRRFFLNKKKRVRSFKWRSTMSSFFICWEKIRFRRYKGNIILSLCFVLKTITT